MTDKSERHTEIDKIKTEFREDHFAFCFAREGDMTEAGGAD